MIIGFLVMRTWANWRRQHRIPIKLLLLKSSFLQRIKRGVQYTNPQSKTVQINCLFLGRHVITVEDIQFKVANVFLETYKKME